MNIKTIKVGYLETNCYILSIGNDVIIIDPGSEYDKIKDEINNKNIIAVLITHNHFDHIGEIDKFDKNKIYDIKNLEEKNYKFNKFNFEVIYTKGHTNDSITYYFKEDNCMFVGDFIFRYSIGRTDLETGNSNEMYESIKKIKEYKNDIIIYPGHGNPTTLKEEKQQNPYFKI